VQLEAIHRPGIVLGADDAASEADRRLARHLREMTGRGNA